MSASRRRPKDTTVEINKITKDTSIASARPREWQLAGRCPRCGLTGCPGRFPEQECAHVHTIAPAGERFQMRTTHHQAVEGDRLIQTRAKGAVYADGKWVGEVTDIQMTVMRSEPDFTDPMTVERAWLESELARVC